MMLGEKIREMREARDLSLREFARRVGVTPGFMSDVELNRRNPSDGKLRDIAHALMTSADALREFDSRPPWREMRNATMSDPEYGFAFRRLVDSDVSPRELLQFLQDRDRNEHREEHEQQ